MAASPKVSVVMSAYNAAAYLDEAIVSILNQTFRDFEFIVINNGSSDDTSSILDKYQKRDGRIRVYYQKQNGLVPALNRGCRLARGQYIAMMDADDVSFPSRLARQLEYLERHPQIGVLGTGICKMDKYGSVTETWCPPTSPKMAKWTLFFGVCVAGPSVLMRREILEKLDFFRTDLSYAEDVDLWLRASSITEFSNVPEVLHHYRVWPGSNTQRHLQSVRETQVSLLASFIKDFLNLDPPIEAVAGLRQLRVGPPFDNLRQIRLTAALIQKLYQKFMKQNDTNSQERREITWDTATKLASLALQASLFQAVTFMPLFMQALRIDYRLLYPSAIMRGLERRRSFKFCRANAEPVVQH
jgi:glycosyltransferase involved in cell wall biosynthesis